MTELTLKQWTTPEYYFGYNPVGDYGVYAKHRDSELLDESNFERIAEALNQFVKDHHFPEPKTRYDHRGDEMPSDWVYTWTAGCWAHGWREYLMIREDAPQELIEYANEIVYDLKHCYPVFDEDDYSRRQDEAICKYWEEMSVKWRVEECREAGVSIFAARRDDIPTEVYDRFYDCGSFA